ncbi:MAG TPA: 4-oxalomesaconate tautomerase, partial [Stellaceae bacterium]|nr:4-oxalomesaconate tautomerase [Stellaceae bacterium]
MRGGTSKAVFLAQQDVPTDAMERERFLLALFGSPDVRQIDGLGGADTLTSKVAIVAKSKRPGVDVDYHFCQVDITKPIVDTSPPCGNMLSGVAPFAIETGMVAAQDGTTSVVIYDVNIKSKIEAVVQTPGGQVNYLGDAAIDGVPGTAAPVLLNFMEIVGAKTGKMLPTGNVIDIIDGVEVTCIDVAMPMIHMKAEAFGLTGYEGREIDGMTEVLARIERIRLEAGRRMGFGDVTDMVIPKVGLLSKPRHGGTITSRYLTPHKLHQAHAVTGAISVSTGCLLAGSVAHRLATPPEGNPCQVTIEHPSGEVTLRMETTGSGPDLQVIRAGTMRTTRPIMQGTVFVPEHVLR